MTIKPILKAVQTIDSSEMLSYQASGHNMNIDVEWATSFLDNHFAINVNRLEHPLNLTWAIRVWPTGKLLLGQAVSGRYFTELD